jgi:hypothetical protein
MSILLFLSLSLSLSQHGSNIRPDYKRKHQRQQLSCTGQDDQATPKFVIAPHLKPPPSIGLFVMDHQHSQPLLRVIHHSDITNGWRIWILLVDITLLQNDRRIVLLTHLIFDTTPMLNNIVNVPYRKNSITPQI